MKAYSTDRPRVETSDLLHNEIGGLLPNAIHELWDEAGLGKLKEGLFELIDPRTYREAYASFFGGDSRGRIPFMINGFGEPIAYKRVRGRQEEISILHTYGPKLEILAYELSDFFDRIMLTDDGLKNVVQVQLFNEVRSRLGRLRPGEVYGFDPLLLQDMPTGTKADASFFNKVDALQQLELLVKRAG